MMPFGSQPVDDASMVQPWRSYGPDMQQEDSRTRHDPGYGYNHGHENASRMFDPYVQRGHLNSPLGASDFGPPGSELHRQFHREEYMYPGDMNRYGPGHSNVMISGYGEQNFFG